MSILSAVNVAVVIIFYATVAGMFGFWAFWSAILIPTVGIWIVTSDLVINLLRKGDSDVEG